MAKERSNSRRNESRPSSTGIKSRDWLPCQLLSMVYSRQIIEGLHTSVISEDALRLFVSVIYRNNNKIAQHFNMPAPGVMCTSLIDMVSALRLGKVPKTKNFFSFSYAWLYLNASKCKNTEEVIAGLTEAIGKVGAEYVGKRGNASDSLPEELVRMYDNYHIQAIVDLFGHLLRVAPPNLPQDKPKAKAKQTPVVEKPQAGPAPEQNQEPVTVEEPTEELAEVVNQ